MDLPHALLAMCKSLYLLWFSSLLWVNVSHECCLDIPLHSYSGLFTERKKRCLHGEWEADGSRDQEPVFQNNAGVDCMVTFLLVFLLLVVLVGRICQLVILLFQMWLACSKGNHLEGKSLRQCNASPKGMNKTQVNKSRTHVFFKKKKKNLYDNYLSNPENKKLTVQVFFISFSKDRLSQFFFSFSIFLLFWDNVSPHTPGWPLWFPCLCLPGAGFADMNHHAQLWVQFSNI